MLETDVDTIYFNSSMRINDIEDIKSKSGKNLIPAVSRITRDIDNIKHIDIKDCDGVLIGNLGQIKAMKREGKNLYSDFSLNVFNILSVKCLEGFGVKNITLSPELNMEEIRDLTRYNGVDYEVIGYGHIPLMITEYCPIKVVNKKGDRACSECFKNSFFLRDRYGLRFPLLREDNCRISILNSQKLFTLEFLKEILESNISRVRLQFTIEGRDEIMEIVDAYRKTMDNLLMGKEAIPKKAQEVLNKYKERGDYTKGHFYRGVL